MPRLSRRDRRIRAAFKRQLYVPDPIEFAEPWEDDDDDAAYLVDEKDEHGQAHEHAH